MKLFTKLALVSAVAMSSNAMAMQAMDDAALSSTTGQDGINLGVKLDSAGITIDQLYIHDNDGLKDTAKGGTSKAGAIVIGNGTTPGVKLTQTGTGNLLDLVIDTDAGSAGAFLNVAANVAGLKVDVGSIGVAASGTKSGAVRGTTGTANEILTGLSLELGSIGANIQLGATPQGAMIVVDSKIANGLSISNLGIKDAANGGVIFVDNIQVVTTDQTYLSANAKVGVTTTGLQIQPVAQKVSTYVTGVHLGSNTAASIGDVEIKGLNLGGSTITISGH